MSTDMVSWLVSTLDQEQYDNIWWLKKLNEL